MDYTDIFTNAVKSKQGYNFYAVKKRIDSYNDLQCGDWDDWADVHWYRLCPKKPCVYEKCYGFISAKFPVALISSYCPEKLKELLSELGIFYDKLEEPMCCDEKVLRQFLEYPLVFDERFIDKNDYSFDDERFEMVLKKLETGVKSYIDSSCFTMEEIR